MIYNNANNLRKLIALFNLLSASFLLIPNKIQQKYTLTHKITILSKE